MSIVYYPNRIFKGKVPAIDRELAKRDPEITQGSKDITIEAIDETISSNTDWQLNSIGLQFSNSTSRTFTAAIKQGRKVVTDLNDYLWFQIPTTLPQRIILDEGFYTGTELAAHLKTKMDANAAFAAEGVTFTVAYDVVTGLFTITPSVGTLKYLNVNSAQTLRTTDSIAGHLFGLTVDGTYGASVVSDTAVGGLDSEIPFISESANTSLAYSDNEVHILDVDQAVHITTNTAGVLVTYTVNHEDIV
jgi:hypothetical protein